MEARKTTGIAYNVGNWPLVPAKSTIIFIHGSRGSKTLWDGQVISLAGRVNTVALDLPGHGGSEGAGKTSVKAYARLVETFIREINAPNPIPCGLSLGGAIVQQLLLDYGDRFCGGILVGTGARLRVLPSIFEAIENDYGAFNKTIQALAASKKTDRKLLEPFWKSSAKCAPAVAAGDFRACDEFDVMDRLSGIVVPVLIISAEDDLLTPPKYGDFLKKNIPNTERAHIMDAGHLAPLEKPQEVTQAIVKFLDRQNL